MVPDKAMVGVPSAEASVHPFRLTGPAVLLKSSIHSSLALASVPIQAISLRTTWRTAVSCAAASPRPHARTLERKRARAARRRRVMNPRSGFSMGPPAGRARLGRLLSRKPGLIGEVCQGEIGKRGRLPDDVRSSSERDDGSGPGFRSERARRPLGPRRDGPRYGVRGRKDRCRPASLGNATDPAGPFSGQGSAE
jgi:hypothetical protein